MTIKEMHKAVLQQLDAMGDNNITVDSEDITRALNKSIDTFVKTRFQAELNPQREGFEMSQVRTSDLRNLVKDSSALSPQGTISTEIDNGFVDVVELPSDFMFLIKATAKIHYNEDGVTYTLNSGTREAVGALNTDYGEKIASCKQLQLDDLLAISSDPFNKPKLFTPKFVVKGSSLPIYTDDKFIIVEAYVTYLKEPATVSIKNSVDCDLAISTHEEIVSLAVENILQSTRSLPSKE